MLVQYEIATVCEKEFHAVYERHLNHFNRLLNGIIEGDSNTKSEEKEQPILHLTGRKGAHDLQ